MIFLRLACFSLSTSKDGGNLKGTAKTRRAGTSTRLSHTFSLSFSPLCWNLEQAIFGRVLSDHVIKLSQSKAQEIERGTTTLDMS